MQYPIVKQGMCLIKAPNKSFQPTAHRALWVNASGEFERQNSIKI